MGLSVLRYAECQEEWIASPKSHVMSSIQWRISFTRPGCVSVVEKVGTTANNVFNRIEFWFHQFKLITPATRVCDLLILDRFWQRICRYIGLQTSLSQSFPFSWFLLPLLSPHRMCHTLQLLRQESNIYVRYKRTKTVFSFQTENLESRRDKVYYSFSSPQFSENKMQVTLENYGCRKYRQLYYIIRVFARVEFDFRLDKL